MIAILSIEVTYYMLDSTGIYWTFQRKKRWMIILLYYFFSNEKIKIAIQAHRCDILLVSLPFYWLINSVLSTKLIWEQRIEQFTFGFSFVVTCYRK